MPTSEADLLALLRLERRSQQATKRDYEILRKQYQRYIIIIIIQRQSFLVHFQSWISDGRPQNSRTAAICDFYQFY